MRKLTVIGIVLAGVLAGAPTAEAQGVSRSVLPPGTELVIDTGAGTVNATLNTGTLDVSKYRTLTFVIIPAGVPTAGALQIIDVASSATIWSVNLNLSVGASKQTAAMGWGIYSTAVTNGNTMSYLGGPSYMLPSIQVQTTALGTGIASRILVYGTR
jgi:hypothetical protein